VWVGIEGIYVIAYVCLVADWLSDDRGFIVGLLWDYGD